MMLGPACGDRSPAATNRPPRPLLGDRGELCGGDRLGTVVTNRPVAGLSENFRHVPTR